MIIRRATDADWSAIWAILEPVFRAGNTYAVDRDISEAAAYAIWMDAPVATYVASDDTANGSGILGTYYIKANHHGGASHICNCGYITAEAAQGRGVARAMCEQSQDAARSFGFRAMQFNLVVASNERAVGLWQKQGFDIIGTLPAAFDHPEVGLVDAHVMWKPI